MSNVSNRHAMVPFTAGESKPFTGQRLAKVGYKKTKDQPSPPASICVSVPHIDPAQVEHNWERLLPYIADMLENAQDGVIRSLYESGHHVMRDISDDDISVGACISYLAAEKHGSRITKEAIALWFDSEIADNLAVTIAEKLGFDDLTPDNMPVVQKHVGTYKQVISMLAGGKTVLEPKQIKGCRNAIALAGADAGIGSKLLARLDEMERKPVIDSFLDI